MTRPSKLIIGATWEDAPHIPKEAVDAQIAELPDYLREARRAGIPSLGQGRIYPYADQDLFCDPFAPADDWDCAFALDAQRTLKSHLVGALSPQGTLYLMQEYQRDGVDAIVQAAAIHAWAPWLRGVGDAALLGGRDGERIRYIDIYRKAKLHIELAEKGVDTGIERVRAMLSQNRIKVCSGLKRFMSEFRVYQYDTTGRPKKVNDHLMDCLRYMVVSIGNKRVWRSAKSLRARPVGVVPLDRIYGNHDRDQGDWMR